MPSWASIDFYFAESFQESIQGPKTFGPLSNIVGYWGNATSTIDWCEQNYVYSHYVAEFWNTVTSLMISFWSLIGLVLVFRNNLEWRFFVINFITCLVGFGSAAFHGTLLIFGQMCDEISMLWYIVVLAFIITQTTTDKTGIMLIISFAMYAWFCSVVHYLGAFVIAFQIHFGVLVVLCALQLRRAGRNEKRSFYSHYPYYSVFLFLCSFTFWLIDQHYCVELSKLDHNPQGHALWHIMNSLTIHYAIQYTLALRLKHHGINSEVKYIFFMPYIVPKGDKLHQD